MSTLPPRPTSGNIPPGAPPRTPGGGPDRPLTLAQRRRRAAKKSKRIVWYGKGEPSKALKKKYKVGKAGAGLFKGQYVALQKKPKPKKPKGPTVGNGTQVEIGPGNTGSLTPPATATPGGPAPYTGPYASLPEWARNYMLGYDGQALHHQAYVADKVLPWIGSALGNIGTFNQAAQDQLLNFYNQGAANQATAASAGPPNVAPVAPGAGPFSGDAAYALNAGKQALGAGSAITQQLGQYQTATAKMAATPISQSVIKSLGDYAAGLPAAYSEKRNERLLQIQQFVEQQRQFDQRQAQNQSQFDQNMALAQERFKEDQRRYGIEFAYRQFNDARNAAIAQLNANNGLILGLGSLGLKGTELAAELGETPGAPPTNLPVGFTVVPTDDGGYEVVRDPTVPQATDGGGGAGGPQVDTRPFKQGTREWFVQNGYKPLPKNAPAKTRQSLQRQGRLVKSVDGSGYWVKVGSGSGSGSGGSGKPAEEVIGKLRGAYTKDINPDDDLPPAQAVQLLGAWISNNRSLAFNGVPLSSSKGRVNRTGILTAITRAIGGPAYVSPNKKKSPWSKLAVATWQGLLESGTIVKRNGNYFWRQ